MAAVFLKSVYDETDGERSAGLSKNVQDWIVSVMIMNLEQASSRFILNLNFCIWYSDHYTQMSRSLFKIPTPDDIRSLKYFSMCEQWWEMNYKTINDTTRKQKCLCEKHWNYNFLFLWVQITVVINERFTNWLKISLFETS